MVRPEKIEVEPQGGPGLGPWRARRPSDAATTGLTGPHGLDGKVEEVVYVGEFTRYHVRVTPAAAIHVKVPNTRAVHRATPGESVRLHWAPDDAYLVPVPSSLQGR
jgi:ABC-type Fe3+/spermidine/putrescine transport system ATPase subunit